jgi:UDP-glucose 4-epimerase
MPHTLVTGANSFVAAHVIDTLIAAGHTVTGSVRRSSAGEEVLAWHPEWKGKFNYVLVYDYAKPNTWDEIFKSQAFDYVRKFLLLSVIERGLSDSNLYPPGCTHRGSTSGQSGQHRL